MAATAPARRPPSRRRPGELLGAPSQHLAPRPATWGRQVTALVAAGVAGFGTAPLLEHPALAGPALTLGVVGGLCRAVQGLRTSARNQLADRLAEALCPGLGLRCPDRRAVRLRSWRRGWRGVPRRVDLRYAPGVDDTDPAWRTELVKAVARRLLADYEVTRHDRRRCRMQLRWVPQRDAKTSPAMQVRAVRTIAELLGPTAAVTDVQWAGEDLAGLDVRHEAGAKLAAPGYRYRVERVVSTMLPGRWRARWDLEADTVRFEVRPSFPTNIWLPKEPVDPGADLLASYDELRISYGVDEDQNVMQWRPAQDPNVMLVGAPGTGKPLAVDTEVPTPSGWTTMGELVDGDIVYDDQGQACTVVTAHPVRHGRPCYRIVFSDGSEIVADADHLWSTSTRPERVSRQRGARGRGADIRKPRLSKAQLARLAAALDDCGDADLISIPDVSRLAGMSASAPILRQLSRDLPVSGLQPRPVGDFVYAEQIVEQIQTVNAYPRRALLQQLSVAVLAGGVHLPHHTAGSILALAEAADPDGQLSTPQLRRLLGVDYNTVQVVLRAVDVAASQRRETVTGTIPAHVEHRRSPGPPVRLHLKRQLLEALAVWGAGRVKDGKTTMAPSSVRSTLEIAATLSTPDGMANHTVRVAAPIQCPAADLPLPPYALGVWAGDGDSRNPIYTSIDPEVAAFLEADGIVVVDLGRPATKPETYRARRYAMRSPVRRRLDELGLLRGADPVSRPRTKHIPKPYLRGSIEQRRALLAGLMDTDGTVSRVGACEFTNTTQQLAYDVHELACSLGYRATIRAGRATLNGRDCGPKWTVAWTTTDRVFRLERKHLVHKERTARCAPERLLNRYITAVEPVASVPVRCITVDSSSRLYLVGRTFIPTHNTVTAHTLLVQVTRRGWPVWVVDGKSVEFLGFQDWPNVQVVATSIEEQVAVIHRAWEVMEHRYQLVTSGRARESDFEPLLVFLDEFADFRGNLAAWYAEVKVKGDPTVPPVLSRVASLARKGRTSRVHLIFGTQRPDAQYFGSGSGGGAGDMRDNFRMRISMGRLSPQGALMMWESPAIGTSIPRGCRGRATTINDANRAVEIQTYRTPDPRKVLPGDQDAALLARLRPGATRHERLLIVPPQCEPDLDTDVVKDPTYTDHVGARWVLASTRPDLDPVLHRREKALDGRALSSPMAVFGLTATETATGHQASGSVSATGPRSASAQPRPRVVPDETRDTAEEDFDHGYGYGPTVDRAASQLEVGDLVLVDEDTGVWGVVDGDPEPDLADPGCIAVSWRGDDDAAGLISVPDDLLLTVRRPVEPDTEGEGS